MIANSLFKVAAIPLFNDNYSYALFSSRKFAEKSHEQKVPCYLVDPADHSKIIEFLNVFPNLQVQNILYTHKHMDHIGYPQQLVDLLKENQRLMEGYKVIASKVDGQHIPTLTYPVFTNTESKEFPNESVTEGEIKLDFLYVPCHTTGHVLYHFKPTDKVITTEESTPFNREESNGYNLYTVDECLFTGDTLFVGGCGRFFEGDATQMLSNMDKIAKIPNKNVKIFCGHEYTKSNLEWSSQVEKENVQLQDWLKAVLQLTTDGLQTIPTTLQKELETNVFMRSHTPTLKRLFSNDDPVHIMNVLRSMKNGNITVIPEANL